MDFEIWTKERESQPLRWSCLNGEERGPIESYLRPHLINPFGSCVGFKLGQRGKNPAEVLGPPERHRVCEVSDLPWQFGGAPVVDEGEEREKGGVICVV